MMVPNRRPTPAVHAMATAPQNATRKCSSTQRGAAKSGRYRAEDDQETQRRPHNAQRQARGRQQRGEEDGRCRPAANEATDATAAWTGRARVISWIPSSSRAWAPRASFAINWSATWTSEIAAEPARGVNPCQLRPLGLGRGRELAPFTGEVSPLGIRLGADRNVFPRRH